MRLTVRNKWILFVLTGLVVMGLLMECPTVDLYAREDEIIAKGMYND